MRSYFLLFSLKKELHEILRDPSGGVKCGLEGGQGFNGFYHETKFIPKKELRELEILRRGPSYRLANYIG